MRSFRLALARRMAGSTLIILLVLGAVTTVGLRALLYRQLDGTLLHLAEVEAEAGAAQSGPEFTFHEGVLLSRRSGAGAELTRYAQLWSSEGQPLARSANLDRDLMLPEAAAARAEAGQVTWDTHRWEGQRIRCIVYPLRLVAAAHGHHLLQVAAPLAPLDTTLTDFTLFGIALTLLAVAAAFGMGWRLAGVALRPTAEITAQAEAIREGTLSPRITAHADVDEFARLVRVLNEMLTRLDLALNIQRRFTADASHELRGPLTALRGELDLALKREREPAQYRETLERCRGEVIRLTRLATDLLTLARTETGLVAQEASELDLFTIAERVAERYRAAAAARGVRVLLRGDPAPVEGDPALLERAVSNLVDNAVKYAPAGSAVDVDLRTGAEVVLTIRDRGPGIPAEDAQQLFNRFFRGTSEGEATGGTGLGLALARAAAEAHGGHLEFLGNDPGAVFRLTLPNTARSPGA
jgi:two-component system OmpR family sensor kinase